MQTKSMLQESPVLRVVDVAVFERPFTLRMPFRFGSYTLTHATQALLRTTIELPGGRATGYSAEVLLPKWFDKRPDLLPDDNEMQLRQSLRHAISAYKRIDAKSAFTLSADSYAGLMEQGSKDGVPPLVTGFGPALLDRSIVDAICRYYRCSFPDAMRRNLVGLRGHDIAPDMREFDFNRFLETRKFRSWMHARHTVGMLDILHPEGQAHEDGPPESLLECVRRYGNTFFKLKLSGDIRWDIDRLTNIASILDLSDSPYFVTLDGNEQYNDIQEFLALWNEVSARPALARLVASTLMVEQPIARAMAFEKSVEEMSRIRPVIIDESDGTLGSFLTAREKGYFGVSTKSCKGLYKSMINAARCEVWNERIGREQYFMSAEDLIIQSGLSLQQDLTLAAFLGIAHIERNGHHYVDGFATCGVTEASAFTASHPDLYDGTPPRLLIQSGRMSLQSCGAAIGFSTSIIPDTAADKKMEDI